MRIQQAALGAVQLLPDGVEQGHVVGRWLVEIEIQMAGQQFVFEHGIQEVERNDGGGGEEPEAQRKAIIAALAHLAVE